VVRSSWNLVQPTHNQELFDNSIMHYLCHSEKNIRLQFLAVDTPVHFLLSISDKLYDKPPLLHHPSLLPHSIPPNYHISLPRTHFVQALVESLSDILLPQRRYVPYPDKWRPNNNEPVQRVNSYLCHHNNRQLPLSANHHLKVHNSYAVPV